MNDILPSEIIKKISLYVLETKVPTKNPEAIGGGIGDLYKLASICREWKSALTSQLWIFKPLAKRTLALPDSSENLIDDETIKEAASFENLLDKYLKKMRIDYKISDMKDPVKNAQFCAHLFSAALGEIPKETSLSQKWRLFSESNSDYILRRVQALTLYLYIMAEQNCPIDLGLLLSSIHKRDIILIDEAFASLCKLLLAAFFLTDENWMEDAPEKNLHSRILWERVKNPKGNKELDQFKICSKELLKNMEKKITSYDLNIFFYLLSENPREYPSKNGFDRLIKKISGYQGEEFKELRSILNMLPNKVRSLLKTYKDREQMNEIVRSFAKEFFPDQYDKAIRLMRIEPPSIK